MSKKQKNTQLDTSNDMFFDERGAKRRERADNKKAGRKNAEKSNKSVPDYSEDGLNVERRVGKQKPPKKEFNFNIPTLDYTRKMRSAGARRGETVLFVYGRYGVRVLGAISKICSVKNVKISSEGTQFEVPSKHRGQIIALLNNLCYDYKIIKVKGAFPLAMNALSRAGLAIGIIAVAIAISLFTQFVTRVSVVATDTYIGDIDNALNTRIDGILSSYGISEGKWLPSLNFAGVEKSLLSLDGVAYASVRRNGTHVTVEIKREQPSESFVQISGSRVTSLKTAVVTRVVVEGGTAVVDYGDVVRKGDTLIDGYVVYGEDKLEVEAKGKVYGKVYHKKTVFFADVDRVREAGAVKTITKLSMFGKLPKTPKSPFECYELETSVSDLGFLLPFKIYTYVFRETVEREQPNTLSDDEMYSRVYSEVVAAFKEPSRVLATYKSITAANGGKYVTVTVEAEERIA